jgi:hypothetical protein
MAHRLSDGKPAFGPTARSRFRHGGDQAKMRRQKARFGYELSTAKFPRTSPLTHNRPIGTIMHTDDRRRPLTDPDLGPER